MNWNNYACVRVDKNNITDFIQLLTTHGFTSINEDESKYRNTFIISMAQKLFTRALKAPSSVDALSVEDFEDLFL